jgi:lysophospholipase
MTSSTSVRRTYPAGSRLEAVPARDGWPLRSFDWPTNREPRGSILFQGGRGDIIEKYLELFGHWHFSGWNVASFDWRGQGGSGRLAADPHVGHCPDFGLWIDDFADFVADWAARTPGPHIIIGHSMGGHLVLRALVEQRIAPDSIVLVAPMLGFETRPLPLRLAAWIVRQLARHWPERSAWKANERPALPWTSRQRLLTSDQDRYSDELWWEREKPELELGPPSLKWVEQAYGSVLDLEACRGIERISIPVLVLGTRGDRLVSPAAIPHFAARIPNATLKMFDASVAHEILRERDGPRDEAIALIDAHLEKLKAMV